MYKMFSIFANKTFIFMENIFKNKSACANCVNWKSGCYSLYPFIEKTNKDFIENVLKCHQNGFILTTKQIEAVKNVLC